MTSGRLLVSSIVDVNIFHFFALETNAVWKEYIKSVQCNNDETYLLFLQDFVDNGVHHWRKDLLNCILPTFTTIDNLHNYCRKNNVCIMNMSNLSYSGWIIDPWSFVDYQPNNPFLDFAAHVKKSMGIMENTVGKYATLVTRKKSRVLYDNLNKTYFEKYFEEFCTSRSIPYKIVCFDECSLKEQAKALADTKVMVSCHGAGNTNVFLLPDNGHLLEINFRKQWHCDPLCDQHFTGNLTPTCKCNGELTWRPYFHKADYHNLAKFFGKKYTELVMENVEGYIDRNPINVKNVYIDSKYIMQNVLAAMSL